MTIPNIELISLNDLDCPIPDVVEDGKTPRENAQEKAIAYYKAFHVPVFSCDSGLYFFHIPDEDQPGVHVRTVKGKRLSDEEMTAHYSALAKKYGNITGRYRNAISLVIDENHVYSAMDETMESPPFILTSTPHPMRKKGFPLDSLSLDPKTGKYFYDLPDPQYDNFIVEDGFWAFLKQYLHLLPEASQ